MEALNPSLKNEAIAASTEQEAINGALLTKEEASADSGVVKAAKRLSQDIGEGTVINPQQASEKAAEDSVEGPANPIIKENEVMETRTNEKVREVFSQEEAGNESLADTGEHEDINDAGNIDAEVDDGIINSEDQPSEDPAEEGTGDTQATDAEAATQTEKLLPEEIALNSTGEIMELAISQIKVDKGVQARDDLDKPAIKEYAERMESGDVFPPCIVYYDGTQYWLADGFHRHEAAKEAKRDTLTVEVRKGSRRVAILHAAGANAKHGLRRKNKDKQKAVETLLKDEEWGRWSSNKIAQMCQVDHKTVEKHRKKLKKLGDLVDSQDSEGNGQQKRKVERGGKQYDMDTTKIGEGKGAASGGGTGENGSEENAPEETPPFSGNIEDLQEGVRESWVKLESFFDQSDHSSSDPIAYQKAIDLHWQKVTDLRSYIKNWMEQVKPVA